MELSTMAEFILDAGVIGVLILGIWAFMTGKLWPKEMVDKTIAAQQESSEKTAEILSQVICEKMANGVADGMERGIAKGYLKINGSDSDS